MALISRQKGVILHRQKYREMNGGTGRHYRRCRSNNIIVKDVIVQHEPEEQGPR
jgi:hypothetical protein